MRIGLICPADSAHRVRDAADKPKEWRVLRSNRISLLAVAAATPPGHEVTFIDEHVEPVDYNAPFDLVGISFPTGLARRAYELGDEFRRRGIPVAFGGYHATFLPDEALQHCDALCVGEAETVWPRMIEDVDRGTMSGQYRADGRLDLSDLPFLRREIMKGDQYLTTNLVLAGRGCPYACEYCSVTEFFGHTYRHRPVEQVVAEIASLPRRLVLFGDDNLVADRDFAKRLFRAMIPLGKKWMSQMNLAVAQDDDLLRLAARSGCCGAFLGLESITQANLVAADKSFYDVARYRELIRKLVDHGIAVMAGFVFGFDEDDDGVFERTIEFATNTPLLAAQIAILTPFPGTKLYSRLERDGRIIDRDWSKYDFRHVVFRPARMTPERLQEGADAAIKQFYGLEEIGRRAVLAVSCWGLKDAFLMGLPINLAYRRSLSKGL